MVCASRFSKFVLFAVTVQLLQRYRYSRTVTVAGTFLRLRTEISNDSSMKSASSL